MCATVGEPAALPSHTPSQQLVAQDDHLVASTLVPQDEAEYERAVGPSLERIARFNPVSPHDFRARLAHQGEAQRTVLVRLRDPRQAAADLVAAGRWGSDRHAPDHALVARINVNNIVRGRFQSAALGYDALDPWAGTGWFARALALTLDLVFTPVDDGGFGLHRVEANVQPHNAASLAVLERVGLRREGYVERMLFVPGPDGREGWQDHVTHALTAEEWARR